MENFQIYPLTAYQEKILFSKTPYPVSNYGKIIFPLDFFQNKYDISGFKSSYTGEKLPDYEIVLFFDKLYQTAQDLCKLSPEFINRQIRRRIVVPLVLFVAGGVIRILAQEESGFFYQLFEVIGRWILQFVSLIWCGLGIAFLYVKAQRDEKNVQLQISGFIQQANIKLDQDSEFKWRAPEDHPYWIELDLMFKEKEHPEAFFKIIEEQNFSDLNVIRFEFDEIARSYQYNIYNVNMTEGYLAKSEVDRFFLLLNKKVGLDLSEEKTRKKLKMLIGFTIFFFIFGVVTGALGHLIISHFVLLGDLLVFLSYGVSFISEKNQKDFEIRNKIRDFIREHNEFYEPLGVRWVLPPPTYKAIELWLDYKFVLEISEKPLDNLEQERVSTRVDVPSKPIEELIMGKWEKRVDFTRLQPPKTTEIDFAKIRNSIFGVNDEEDLI